MQKNPNLILVNTRQFLSKLELNCLAGAFIAVIETSVLSFFISAPVLEF